MWLLLVRIIALLAKDFHVSNLDVLELILVD